jgi:predicted aminopeptidase
MSWTRPRLALAAGASLLLLLAGSAIPPDGPTGYLARQGWFQLELLWGRVPLAEVEAHRALTAKERERLADIPRVQAWAAAQGLAVHGHYETINPTWDRTIWNVSACDPVSFRVRRWWFPIVGRVPYLGYFREADADRRVARLESEGLDVYKRTAGAYSTLGWFEDPVLPQMLSWSEERLANTLIHELAHATLWIPGSVAFNESFASFVGDEGAARYLADTHGPDSAPAVEVRRRQRDRARFRALLYGLYQDLDSAFSDPALTSDQKLARKAALYASLPERIAASDLEDREHYRAWVAREPWNNARLAQFRTYNESPEQFAALFAACNSDFPCFFQRIDEATRGADDPYAALAEAVRALAAAPP